MSVKDGKDYLYLIWKCSSNRRQYIVGQLSKNGQYEFCYCEEFNEAVKEGFSPLMIIPGLSEPPVRTLRATIPENGSHIFR